MKTVTTVMTWAAMVAALIMGCSRVEPAAARGSEDSVAADRAVVGDTAVEPTAERPGGGAEPGGTMPMGGRMGAMHGRMMGGAGAGAAPRAEAAAASAPDCPDVSQDLVDDGRQVFAGPGTCFACHGAEATGSQLAPDLTDAEWLNVDGSYASIVELVGTGVSEPKQFPAPMPPMGGASLTPDQVCAVAAYVYSLSH